MRYRAVLVLVCSCCLVLPDFSAYARKRDADPARQFQRQVSRDEKVLQTLNRLTFGPRPGDAELVRKMGLKKWIDRQLHPEQIAENPALAEKLKMLDTLDMSSEELVRNYPTPQLVKQMVAGQIPFPSDPERRRMVQRLVARAEKKQGDRPDPAVLNRVLTPQQPSAPAELRRKLNLSLRPQQIVARDLAEGKLLRAIYSERQLNEILVDFWFNHFNVFLDKGADRFLVTAYEREAIRPHVLGKFKDLLAATAKSPAMLFYLDNWQSGRRGLNENYGRELLELHTLGVDGGYTQKDVTETARCFTGWTIKQPQRGGAFQFNPRLHDDGEKTVLGMTIPSGGGMEDGEKVLDLVARHPSTARFISRKLAQRFVADEPPAGLVDRMAMTFEKTDGDLRAVMKTMLDSKEFWSVGAYRSKMKTPLETVASAVRAINGDVDFAFALANQVAQLGEPLYRKVEPTGYSNSSLEWLNSAGLLARMNFALQLSAGKVPGVKVEAVDAARASVGSPEFQKH
jgi:uncharacterized protein (DUF1800 family)